MGIAHPYWDQVCRPGCERKISESNFQIYPLCDLGTSVQGAMFLYLQWFEKEKRTSRDKLYRYNKSKLTVGFQYNWTNSFVFLLRRIIADCTCSWLIAADYVTKSEDQWDSWLWTWPSCHRTYNSWRFDSQRFFMITITMYRANHIHWNHNPYKHQNYDQNRDQSRLS